MLDEGARYGLAIYIEIKMRYFPKIRSTAETYLATNPGDNLYLLIDNAGMPDLHSKLAKSTASWKSLSK